MKLLSFYQEHLKLYITPRLTTLLYTDIVPIEDRQVDCAVKDKEFYAYITKASLIDCINRLTPFRLHTRKEKYLIGTEHLLCEEDLEFMQDEDLVQIDPESYSQILLVKDINQ